MRAVGWLLLLLAVISAGLLALVRWQPKSVPEPLMEMMPGKLLQAVSLPGAEGISTTPTQSSSAATDPNGSPIYAWKDDQGRWNYTDEPPPDRPYETRQYRQDVNVVPAYSDGTVDE